MSGRRGGCSSHLIGVALATWALAGGVAAQRGGSYEDVSGYLPPGEGKQLFVPACAGCHELVSTLRLRQSREAWEAMILDMGARGAPVLVDDVEPLATYLAAVFGSTAPPFADVNVATREDLVKLPGVTSAAADRLIAVRGKAPLTSAEQVRAALGLDPQPFEKIKYYLYVKPSEKESR